MDLCSFISVQTGLLVPVVIIYFLFFKGNDGKRDFFNRLDIFYAMKICFAKNVVKRIQKRRKDKREKYCAKDVEPAIDIISDQYNYTQSFLGTDQNGNALKLKFTLHFNKTAEVDLFLKLENGNIYSFQESENKIFITSIKDFQWKIKGLSIENLEAYRRVRLVFNGILKNITENRREHVQFNFIFNSASVPKFYPEDCNSNLLAEELATTIWRDATWKNYLNNSEVNGYEQFGVLYGFIKGEYFPAEKVLNLPAWRSNCKNLNSNYSGIQKELRIFLVANNGILLSLSLKVFTEGQTQLSYGYILHKNYLIREITTHDIRFNKLITDTLTLPDIIKLNFLVSSQQYSCVLNLDKNLALLLHSLLGDDFNTVYAECDINENPAKALVEFKYCDNNHHQQLLVLKTHILSEKKVNELPKDMVINIRSEKAEILQITGGKANSLALLASLKSKEFAVPDGFIITTNAFNHHIKSVKLLEKAIQDIDDAFCGRTDAKTEEICSQAVRLFINESIQQELAQEIKNHLKNAAIGSQDDNIDVVSWAVRSSAIGEDSEELSAAGQNETILGCVTDIEVLKAVAKCWASLFTYQSVQYRWQHGLPINIEMAVVVQKMVPAETAGVLFTWHPTNSNPLQMVITSNYGLGESVVSGKSEPDTFILNRTYEGDISIMDQTIGTKDKICTLTSNGVQEISTIDNEDSSFVHVRQKNLSLTESQVLRLGNLGLLLEDAFGDPRDIEWAFYKDDLYLLQSRPITTLNNWTDFELETELNTPFISENSLYTRANIGEIFPGGISSLGQTTILRYLDKAGQKAAYGTDAIPNVLVCYPAFHQKGFIDCILCIHSGTRDEEVRMNTKILDLAFFGHRVFNQEICKMVYKRLGPLSHWEKLKAFKFWINSTRVVALEEQFRKFVEKIDFGIKETDTAESIYHKILMNDDILDKPSYLHCVISGSSLFWQIVCMLTLVAKENDLTADHYADFASFLSSCEDVESAEVPAYLYKIAKVIRDEGYSEEFCAIQPELGVSWFKTKCPHALRIFEKFIEKHGHRSLAELDLITEKWGENPTLLIPMIQANVKYLRDEKKQNKSVEEVLQNLKSPISFIGKKILKFALKKLRVAVGKREQSKSLLVLSSQKLRLAYKKLAKAMVSEGLMPKENLIFHLTQTELGQLVQKRNPLLINKAMRREKLFPKWCSNKFPELNFGLPHPEEVFSIPIEAVPGSKCSGTPVYIGDITARACVINNLDEIGSLEKGDILITYCTDIGWSPYFPMLEGVVTELGGLVSHGAVVAREYGLPCIVGVRNVTKLFKTGDLVHLSGSTGQLWKV